MAIGAKVKGSFYRQRQFFDNLAKEKGFDPVRDSKQWAGISKDDVIAREVGVVAVRH